MRPVTTSRDRVYAGHRYPAEIAATPFGCLSGCPSRRSPAHAAFPIRAISPVPSSEWWEQAQRLGAGYARASTILADEIRAVSERSGAMRISRWRWPAEAEELLLA